MSSTTPNPAGEGLPSRRSLWESIVTLTPVVMTVVATLLAGLSSSEMTQSMYHRSVAGQNQSKVSDQWAFYQAKRIRGNELELAADNLRANHPALPLDYQRFKETAANLEHELHSVAQEVAELEQHSAAAFPDTLRSLCARFPRPEEKKEPGKGKNLVQRLDDAEVKEVFPFLTSDRLPVPKDARPLLPPAVAAHADEPDLRSVTSIRGERFDRNAGPLSKAVAAVIDGNGDLDRLSMAVKVEELHAARQIAEANARAFDDAGNGVDKILSDLEALVEGDVARARAFRRWVRDFKLARTDPAVAREFVERLERHEAVVQAAADDLHTDFKTAYYDYTARRNREEAKYNRATANLYEVQVHRSGGESDRHRTASQFFFLGMLGAQGGVTIASLSLAARKKSVLWLLAAFLGVAAVVFSAWVWWSMWIA